MPFNQYCALHPIGHVETAQFLKEIIDNERIGPDLLSMHRHVHLLDKSDESNFCHKRSQRTPQADVCPYLKAASTEPVQPLLAHGL
jgi:hypothetical protein